MKIGIVVHGRFHAFDFARELSRKHEVTVFTNYPKWAAKRFGLSRDQVRSNWKHGLLSRGASWLTRKLRMPYPESTLHSMFGRWAARQVRKESWDVIHSFSGVSEELLLSCSPACSRRLIVRGSAHIRTQAELLEQEERRTGISVDRPSPWMIAREEREYALADKIVTLSNFARSSFLSQGVEPSKIGLMPLGTQIASFRASPSAVEARCRRIVSGHPLRILYVGSLSIRKGMWDMHSVLRSLDPGKFRVRFVGDVSPEADSIVADLKPLAEFYPRQPQLKLRDSYSWGDLFVFPTIEDGFAVVLAQAQANALPILTTTNCCGPDIVNDGETGWVLPIRSPHAFLERLQWCDRHRNELVRMVRFLHREFQPRTWADVASDFENICNELTAVNGR